jgi:hypothetical protein
VLNRGEKKPDVFADINGLVLAFLDDVSGRPVPCGAESLLAEIRRAAAEGRATTSMALKIIELFPTEGQSGPGADRSRLAG